MRVPAFLLFLVLCNPLSAQEAAVKLICQGTQLEGQGDPDRLSQSRGLLPRKEAKIVVDVTRNAITQVDGGDLFKGDDCRFTNAGTTLLCNYKKEDNSSRYDGGVMINRTTGFISASSKSWYGKDIGFYFSFDGYCAKFQGDLF